MLTITFCKGLPGSGKSTWAEQEVLKSNCGTVRVNKDSLRAMLHGGKYSKGNEAFVLDMRDEIIFAALCDGKHVIVDDTNFEPKHLDAVQEQADRFRASGRGAVKVVVRFFDTPLEECIARDNKRANGVGEKVIRTMYNKYLRSPVPEWVPAQQDTTLHGVVIVDIDGTLAKMGDRSPYDWSKVGVDRVHRDIADLVDDIGAMRSIILVSGRDESCREQTVAWLDRHDIKYDMLLMRPAGNNEKDTIIKERIYREHILGKYHVDYVLDDRDQVVKLWRSLGLRCLQVADGNF